jgi:ParB family transcriptional regulator, chromosome partitioning protein
MKKQKGLGRGLEALLRAPLHGDVAPEGMSNPAPTELRLDELATGNLQPRGAFPEESLAELADSIREQGILQPLIVRPRPSPDGPRYEIVAGERRWRAARQAGLATVPVLVRELDDPSALAIALIENLQREDLNPLDQARSLARLVSEFGLTHEEVAKALGRSRASVSNLLRLLGLHDEVKAMLSDGRLQMGHARALLSLDTNSQLAIARSSSKKGLSVRQVEDRVRRKLEDAGASETEKPRPDLQTQWLQSQLAAELGQKFDIRRARDGSYRLNFPFGDLEQLEGSLRRLIELLGQVRQTAGPRARESSH